MSVLQERGTVIDVFDQKAKVKITRKSECENCKAARFCGMLNRQFMVLEALNPVSAQKGEEVLLEMEVEEEKKATMVVYLIPLVLFLIGILVGYNLPFIKTREISSTILGFAFLFISFIGIGLYSRKRYQASQFVVPVIKKVVGKNI